MPKNWFDILMTEEDHDTDKFPGLNYLLHSLNDGTVADIEELLTNINV